MSYLHYLCRVVFSTCCVVFLCFQSSCVLPTQCYQFLWILHSSFGFSNVYHQPYFNHIVVASFINDGNRNI